MSNDRRSRTLYRDPNDKVLGGVCSGLGHYFDIDTVLVRVAFIVVTLLGGGGALGYVILWAILDPAPPGALDQPRDETAIEPPPPIDTLTEPDPGQAGYTTAEPPVTGVPATEPPPTEPQDENP